MIRAAWMSALLLTLAACASAPVGVARVASVAAATESTAADDLECMAECLQESDEDCDSCADRCLKRPSDVVALSRR